MGRKTLADNINSGIFSPQNVSDIMFGAMSHNKIRGLVEKRILLGKSTPTGIIGNYREVKIHSSSVVLLSNNHNVIIKDLAYLAAKNDVIRNRELIEALLANLSLVDYAKMVKIESVSFEDQVWKQDRFEVYINKLNEIYEREFDHDIRSHTSHTSKDISESI